MKLGHVELVGTGKRMAKEVLNDDVNGLAAELAYRFFLALFPFFIFLAALGGFVATLLGVTNPTDQVMELLGEVLPADAASVVRRQLDQVVASRNAGLLSVGIVTAIWTGSSGIRATMKAMNRAYDVRETRSFWKKYLVSIGLTLLAGSFVVGAFVLLVVGQLAGRQVAEAIGMPGAYQTAVTLARWPAAIVLLLVATAFWYWAAPNIALPFKWITPGAVLFTVVWLVATALFSLYVANFGAYNATYGTLGGVAVLLLWFYLTSLILLAGAELNAVVDDQIDPPGMAERRRRVNEPPQAQHETAPPTARAAAPWPTSAAAPDLPRLKIHTVLGAFVAGILIGRLLGTGGRTAGRTR